MIVQWIERLVESFGLSGAMAMAGLAVGILFGFMAQKSRFCLRAATVEFITGHFGTKLAIWLLTFGVAITGVQFLIAEKAIDIASTRAIAAPGSMSGAIVGGLMFGCGMVLARGCASRLLVLSATGNLRALIAGLVFVVVAQASLHGILEPARLWLSALWMVEGGTARDLVLRLGGHENDKLPLAMLWLVIAFLFAVRGRIPLWGWIGGIGCGLAVALAYYLTSQIALAAIEPGDPKGITFSGPSAEVLMRLLQQSDKPVGFDTLLVPGVFLGSAVAAILAREWRLTVFDTKSGMLRYMVGASLMGFGAMAAGGCAVGAGVSGGAIFALTAWLALIGMWLGAGATHWLVDEERRPKAESALNNLPIPSGRLISKARA